MNLVWRTLAGLTLLLTGCVPPAAVEPTATTPTLVDSHWQVTQLTSQALDATRPPTLTFAPDNRAHGYAGCNRFFAQYEQAQFSLQFSRVGSTRMSCDQVSNQIEQTFLRGLLQVRALKQEDGRLQLLDAQGQALMELTAAPAQ